MIQYKGNRTNTYHSGNWVETKSGSVLDPKGGYRSLYEFRREPERAFQIFDREERRYKVAVPEHVSSDEGRWTRWLRDCEMNEKDTYDPTYLDKCRKKMDEARAVLEEKKQAGEEVTQAQFDKTEFHQPRIWASSVEENILTTKYGQKTQSLMTNRIREHYQHVMTRDEVEPNLDHVRILALVVRTRLNTGGTCTCSCRWAPDPGSGEDTTISAAAST